MKTCSVINGRPLDPRAIYSLQYTSITRAINDCADTSITQGIQERGKGEVHPTSGWDWEH